MAVQKIISGLAVFTLLFVSSTATPLSSYEPYSDLLPRQGFDQTCGWNRPKEDPCPGMYYQSDLSCQNNATAVTQAIKDAGLIAHAALRALYSGSQTLSPNATLTNAPINPAQHYFYFFDNDRTVAANVASTFQNIANCADGRDCPNNLIICGDQRGGPSQCDRGQYGYVLDPNQTHGQTINNQPKGGGVVFFCNAGMALHSNPQPCSTPGGAPGIGYALLYQMVQVDVITRPDTDFLEQKTGQPNITQITYSSDGKTSLNQIGWGTAGDGLKAKGLANAENYARFASWSWDLGYGGAPWTGETCERNFANAVREEGLVPVEG
ncbi:MAG: hypothetical protein LQ350_008264 [Teloschistes chrysophthalmus]|nr:MAG: hypothetical protein LQ350_008264 [Niorma chrysophthalma]